MFTETKKTQKNHGVLTKMLKKVVVQSSETALNKQLHVSSDARSFRPPNGLLQPEAVRDENCQLSGAFCWSHAAESPTTFICSSARLPQA